MSSVADFLQNLMSKTVSIPTQPSVPASSDIIAGRVLNPGGGATLITIPAGRTWKGEVGATVSAGEAGGANVSPFAQATFSTAGANVSPAAGTYLSVDCRAGANVATGTVGNGVSNFGKAEWLVAAPADNSVTIMCSSVAAGTTSDVDCFAFGYLL